MVHPIGPLVIDESGNHKVGTPRSKLASSWVATDALDGGGFHIYSHQEEVPCIVRVWKACAHALLQMA